MKRILSLLVLIILPSVYCMANDSYDTLRYYLSKSELVLFGTIVNEPVGLIDEEGVVNYITDFMVKEVLKGETIISGDTLKVNIIRHELSPEDRLPLIRQHSDCILFLNKARKGDIPEWLTSDFWFAVQYPSLSLATSLKQLNQEK